MESKGHSSSDVSSAIGSSGARKAFLPKSVFVHTAILIAVIIAASIPLAVMLIRDRQAPPPLEMEGIDYGDIHPEDIVSFTRYLEHAINTDDGRLYFELLSSDLKDLACARWSVISEQFSRQGDCLDEMDVFYSREIGSKFPGSGYKVELTASRPVERGMFIQGTVKRERSNPLSFSMTDDFRMASDYILDASIRDI